MGYLEASLQTAVQMGTPLLFATLGAIMCEKVGHLNLGVEGMMILGAMTGFFAGTLTESPIIVILVSAFAGMIGALIYALITVTFMGNQTVTGLVLTIFGTGVANFYGTSLQGQAMLNSNAFKAVELPILSNIPYIGKALFNQSIYVYISLILAVGIWFYINKTKFGLNMRAIGENPASADASGINITLYKYVHILIGGALCGMGGAYISTSFVGRWQQSITGGQGYIAVALVIFAMWSPIKAIFGAYLFGILRGAGIIFQNVPIFGVTVSSQLLDMIPYVMTIIVLISMRKMNNKAPNALGVSYFREDR